MRNTAFLPAGLIMYQAAGSVERRLRDRYLAAMTSRLGISAESDQELWKRVLNGDNDAFQQLYERYARQILAFLESRCWGRLSGEDLAHDAWRLALERKNQCDGKNVRAWLFQIAHRRLYDASKSADRKYVRNVSENFDQASASSDQRSDEQLDAMRECLDELGGDFVQVIRLRLDEKSDDEIAQAMGIEKNSVYSRASRGRDQVKDCIEKKLA